jgi:hypothetical protein
VVGARRGGVMTRYVTYVHHQTDDVMVATEADFMSDAALREDVWDVEYVWHEDAASPADAIANHDARFETWQRAVAS